MQRSFAEDDLMIQILAAIEPNEPFDVSPMAFTWSTKSLPITTRLPQ
jgi:hypothetical protein